MSGRPATGVRHQATGRRKSETKRQKDKESP
jgi:hypothetical protein